MTPAAWSTIFYATVILSTIVVAIGLMRDNPAVIIGAMVIAPLLGPNVALALATTLSEPKLMRMGLRSNAIGFVLALTITILLGLLAPHVVGGGESASRFASCSVDRGGARCGPLGPDLLDPDLRRRALVQQPHCPRRYR